MTRQINRTTGPFAAPTYDETVMEVLDRLDALKGIAIAAEDRHLAEGLSEIFDSFLTRYCESRHAALNARFRQDRERPKALIH